jgi:hypothetical protein
LKIRRTRCDAAGGAIGLSTTISLGREAIISARAVYGSGNAVVGEHLDVKSAVDNFSLDCTYKSANL